MGKRNDKVNPQRKRVRFTKEFKLEAGSSMGLPSVPKIAVRPVFSAISAFSAPLR